MYITAAGHTKVVAWQLSQSYCGNISWPGVPLARSLMSWTRPVLRSRIQEPFPKSSTLFGAGTRKPCWLSPKTLHLNSYPMPSSRYMLICIYASSRYQCELRSQRLAPWYIHPPIPSQYPLITLLQLEPSPENVNNYLLLIIPIIFSTAAIPRPETNIIIFQVAKSRLQ